jgi:hypothetical protein
VKEGGVSGGDYDNYKKKRKKRVEKEGEQESVGAEEGQKKRR